MTQVRIRLDRELVRRGLFGSREDAQLAIAQGRITVGGASAQKPTRLVSASEAIELLGDPPRFVSRGGEKLAHGLEQFSLDPKGRACVDLGASTGGFTDCLLQAGAQLVWSIDVGYGQIHPKIRDDDRVRVLERTNVRAMDEEVLSSIKAELGESPLLVADLSFISLKKVASVVRELLASQGTGILLVKPQFEVGRQIASQGKGVVRDPAAWLETLLEVGQSFEALGLGMQGVARSPLRGPAGNVEFLIHLEASRPSLGWQDEAMQLTTLGESDG
jgi:23S rRNA (cytidine1920-2'-O)/16S rRNA (cytidine1409-2'-O)-methyltransferase